MALQRHDWVKAGLKALAAEGIDQVRVERLARDLKVTKGGFYWHFHDREELLEAMVVEWELHQTQRVIDQSDVESSPARRIERLFHLVADTVNGRLDAAVHAWARKEPRVAARVSAVEVQRTEYLTRQFAACGFPLNEAQQRARIAYMVYLGWVDWGSRNAASRSTSSSLAQLLVRLLLTPLPLDMPGPERTLESE